ncbi:hypothetical protein Taro_032328 [Colocasia esculenta]|uniref:Phospholipid/glycerol acyltransferase domain-containing protein n=1 Tax=Colocasia esculenta TaxID=4460 RepID=A0A843W5U1_COLES|nr:hypothetical protein [Colocasia esculenta]
MFDQYCVITVPPYVHVRRLVPQEFYEVSEADRRRWRPLPRQRCPKPLVFHDGRLAFRPTPAATLVMFLWLPVAVPLATFRLVAALFLPYKLSTLIEAMTGVRWYLKGALPPPPPRDSALKGRLFACNHRTLADPIYISIALDKPVTAVTYSLSKVSEWVSLIKTARLTKSKEEDRKLMEELLRKGDLVVCPEGTTCREPYLLRFSPLFTELCNEVVPVAVDVKVSMFYATTARGFKGLDTFYFLMNPWTRYEMEFLERIQTSSAVREGRCSSFDMANRVQAVIGRALRFECTSLTRKDKYLMLAGNEGVVAGGAAMKPSR